MHFIKAEHLTKTYGDGEARVHAVADISLEIDTGDFVGIMGESGSGKSTLLTILGAMNTPSQGRYIVDDIDVYDLSTEQRADFRREFIGFVFQGFHLVPYLTVRENVMLPLTTAPLKRDRKAQMAQEALARVGLADKGHRLPNEISGGEQERTAVARAIVNQPPLLLADEPTGNLDSRLSSQMMEMFRQLNDEGTTIVMVTHSEKCAAAAGRILRVRDGRWLAETATVH
jgi:putative ABC transport system ATP-binding protein